MLPNQMPPPQMPGQAPAPAADPRMARLAAIRRALMANQGGGGQMPPQGGAPQGGI